MILIPAIDLRAGRVVRLEQGDYGRETRYDDNPLAVAERYADAGAKLLHIVDLDSARDGGRANLSLIADICHRLDLPVQTGGGVRSRADIDARIDAGARQVVIGSLCVQQPDLVAEWLDGGLSDIIVAGLDVSQDDKGQWVPKAAGWTEAGAHDLDALLEQLVPAGLRHVLCTDIARDGMFAGPSLALYESICRCWPTLAVQASGGIACADDLNDVAETGVAGCIVGKALLEGRLAIEEIGKWSR